MNSVINDMSYALAVIKIMSLSLAGIFALVGTIKIFNKWQTGSYNAGDGGALYYDILLWGGSCIFFLVGRVVISIIF